VADIEVKIEAPTPDIGPTATPPIDSEERPPESVPQIEVPPLPTPDDPEEI
jgi:hypothetical protein